MDKEPPYPINLLVARSFHLGDRKVEVQTSVRSPTQDDQKLRRRRLSTQSNDLAVDSVRIAFGPSMNSAIYSGDLSHKGGDLEELPPGR